MPELTGRENTLSQGFGRNESRCLFLRSVRIGVPALARCEPESDRWPPSAPTPDLPAQVFVPDKMAPLTKVEVFPAEIQLTTARDRQSIVVQAAFADGITRDVTGEASINPADAKMLRRVGATFYPSADGATTVAVALRRQDESPFRSRFHRRQLQIALELPARCHAGVHAVGMQHGKLPRGGTRQGRLSNLAVSASIPKAIIFA